MRRLAATSLALAALSASPLPAFAGAVTGYTGVDGFAPVPIARGTFVLDTRVNIVAPGVTASPTLNVLAGLTDSLELGVGSYLNVSNLGAGATGLSADLVYPWVRGSLPGLPPVPGLRLGYMAGGDIPLRLNSSAEAAAGLTLLLDYPAGPGLVGFAGGYKRGFETGMNRLSANVNYTYTLGNWMFYEENLVNAPLGGATDGAVRGCVCYYVTPAFCVDVNPAVTFIAGPALTASFNPNVGVAYTF
jgi:hypothetical protein